VLVSDRVRARRDAPRTTAEKARAGRESERQEREWNARVAARRAVIERDRPIDTLRVWLRVPANCVLWALRRVFGKLLSSPTKPILLRPEVKAGVFEHLEGAVFEQAVERERTLRSRYDLTALRAEESCAVYRETLVFLDALEPLAEPVGAALVGNEATADIRHLRVLDVGSRNWTYVHALRRWFDVVATRARARATITATANKAADQPTTLELVGVEIDGFWLNRDGRPRCDHARDHADRAVAGTDHTARYEIGDLTKRTPPRHPGEAFDVVTMFFPFVTLHALLAWGLPPWLYRPQQLFTSVRNQLRPGGQLVTWHQTTTEARAAQQHARVVGLELRSQKRLKTAFGDPVRDGDRWQLVFERPMHTTHEHTEPAFELPSVPPRRTEPTVVLHPEPARTESDAAVRDDTSEQITQSAIARSRELDPPHSAV
jgi:SAM-dependent methyltransferase